MVESTSIAQTAIAFSRAPTLGRPIRTNTTIQLCSRTTHSSANLWFGSNHRCDIFNFVQPVRSRHISPGNDGSDPVVLILNVTPEDRLMMGDAIAQITDFSKLVEAFPAKLLNGFRGIGVGENRHELLVPDGGVMALGEHSFPKHELEFCHNFPGRRQFAQSDQVPARAIAKLGVSKADLKAFFPWPVCSVRVLDRRNY